MNEIFLDTETTGLSFKDGHKIVEIACIETNDLIPTGKVFHKLINPKRNMPSEAYKVHGFSEEFLSNKETFDIVADEFLKFIKDKKIFVPKKGYYEGNTYKFLKTKVKRIFKKDIFIFGLKNFDEILLIGSGKGVTSVKTIKQIGWRRNNLKYYKFFYKHYQLAIKKCNFYKF